MQKKLYRSRNDRKLTGVCGGIGEYFGIDSNIVRLIFVLLGFTTVGIIAYIAASLLLPEA